MSNEHKKCEVCGAEMAKNAKTCPGCGAKNKKPIYKRVWFWIIIVILVAAAASAGKSGSRGDSSNTDNRNTEVQQNAPDENSAPAEQQAEETAPAQQQAEEAAPAEEKKEPLSIEGEVVEERDAFSLYLTGVVKNNTDREKAYAQITFNLFDAEGNQIGTAMDNINNLAPGGTWKFKAMALTSDDVASYEFAGIDAW